MIYLHHYNQKEIHYVLKYGYGFAVSVHSKTSQKVRKKCSTGQRFICTEVTSHEIHILVESANANDILSV